MKHLRYTGGAHIRQFSAEDLQSIEVDEEPLEFDRRKGGVLQMKNDSADRLIELYPNDFEVVDKEQAEQLQMNTDAVTPLTPENDPNPTASSSDTVTGATATRSSTRTG